MEIPEGTKVHTFYVGADNIANISCPKCGHTKSIDVSKFKNVHRPLKTHCRCGDLFYCKLEFKKRTRKQVRLPGTFYDKNSDERGEMFVEEISLTGLLFVPLGRHHILPNDKVGVVFNLDNTNRTEIKRVTTIKSVNGDKIEAAFSDSKIDRDLNFYLLP